MASLLEIAAVPRTVPIRGKDVEVHGISGEGIAALMIEFPEFGKLFSGAIADSKAMMKMAAPALAAFIAAGTGLPGDKAAMEIARKLGVGEQLDLVDEILRLTIPRGIGPFVEKLQALGVMAQVDPALLTSSPDKPKS